MARKDPSLNSTYKASLREKHKNRAIEYKGGKCSRCGEVYPYYVYDFHHVDPSTKEGVLNALLDRAWEGMVDELDKCILLCANCHRIVHHGELEDRQLFVL